MLSKDAKAFVYVMHEFKKYTCIHGKDTTQTEFITLMIIARAEEEKETITVSELAIKLKNTMPGMSRTIKNLEQKGYVERVMDKNDRRAVNVVLTNRGREIVNHQIEVVDEFTNRIIERFGSEDLASMIQLLQKLQTIMQEEMKKDEWKKNITK